LVLQYPEACCNPRYRKAGYVSQQQQQALVLIETHQDPPHQLPPYIKTRSRPYKQASRRLADRDPIQLGNRCILDAASAGECVNLCECLHGNAIGLLMVVNAPQTNEKSSL
jgi:hypothetical protein